MRGQQTATGRFVTVYLCGIGAVIGLPATSDASEFSGPPAPTQSSDGGTAGICPGSGDCCEANGTPGCDDSACCQAICELQPLCCTAGWTQECANFALTFCQVGSCAGGSCPGTGSCCSSNNSPGCSDATCCATICAADPFCCSSNWDTECVMQAIELCDDLCFNEDPCLSELSCCYAHLSVGCKDRDCCKAVCAEDQFCCAGEWDEICAATANDLCGKGDGTYCDWCPGPGTCCAANATPGCDRAACCEAVCAVDSRCCTNFWFGLCAGIALDVCAPTVCACDNHGDLDDDGQIDLRDVAAFMNCFTGPDGALIDEPCACADFDGDGRVDLADYQALRFLLTP